MPPHVSLEPVDFAHKPVLRRLLELYSHDFSEFTGNDISEFGEFGYRYLDHYWTDGEDRHAFFIRADGRLAGFAMVRRIEVEWSMAEFFVLRKYRRAGVGSAAAITVFRRFPGRWFVHQLTANTPAQAFWRRVIGTLPVDSAEGTDAEGTWQRFEQG